MMIGDRMWGMQNFELQGKDPERIQMNYNLLGYLTCLFYYME